MTSRYEEINFEECEREPLLTPGVIQSHGAVLILDRPSHVVLAASKNSETFLGLKSEDLLGATLSTLGTLSPVLDIVERVQQEACEGTLVCVSLELPLSPLLHFDLRIHHINGRVAVEFHPLVSISTTLAEVMDESSLEQLRRKPALSEGNLFRAARAVVDHIAQVTGCSRSSIYKFHHDWSGEVIAEYRVEHLEPFLGLRYPATDIPAQVRKQYLKVPVREIVNIESLQSPLVCIPDLCLTDFDMTYVTLRGVSPYHLEYLYNMGVTSSTSFAVITSDSLWGLITLHSETPLRMSNRMREHLLGAAELFASRVTKMKAQERAQQQTLVSTRVSRLSQAYKQCQDLVECLLFGPHRLSTTLGADGAVVIAGTYSFSTGLQPLPSVLGALLKYLENNELDSLCTDNLSLFVSEGLNGCCGALMRVLSFEPLLVIALFRGEITQHVKWGGNPDIPASFNNSKGRLEPRASFEQWKTEIRGCSLAWEEVVQKSFTAITQWIVSSGFADMEALSKELQEEIRKHAHRLENLLDLRHSLSQFLFSDLAFVVWEGEIRGSKRLFPSAPFCALFGLDEEELHGRDVMDVLSRIGASVNPSEVFRSSECVELWSPTEGVCSIEISAHQILELRTGSGSRRFSVMYFEDRTRETLKLNSLMAINRKTGVTAERLSFDLLGGMSHELRTPLNVMTGFAQLLLMQKDGALTQKQQEYAQEIVRAGKHVTAIVSDSLDFSKVQSGKLALREEVFDLRKPLQEVFDWIKEDDKRKQLSLQISVPTEDFTFLGDRKAIRQIVLNLLSNAKKFTPEDGKITLTLCKDSFSGAKIVATDSGIGIPLHLRARIFEPFFQIDDPTAGERTGTGLGLTLVRALTELHGGYLTVEDAGPEGGTSFSIIFPSWRTLEDGKQALSSV